jgi:transposase
LYDFQRLIRFPLWGWIVAASEDLRIRLVRKVASGMSGRQAAAHFDVSASSAVRFVKRYEDEGTVAVKPRPPRQRRLDPYGEDILRWIKETPDLTLQELSQRLHERHEVVAPISTIDDWLRSRKISFKINRTRQ